MTDRDRLQTELWRNACERMSCLSGSSASFVKKWHAAPLQRQSKVISSDVVGNMVVVITGKTLNLSYILLRCRATGSKRHHHQHLHLHFI